VLKIYLSVILLIAKLSSLSSYVELKPASSTLSLGMLCLRDTSSLTILSAGVE